MSAAFVCLSFVMSEGGVNDEGDYDVAIGEFVGIAYRVVESGDFLLGN